MASLVADYGESSQESTQSDDSEAENNIIDRVEEVEEISSNERLPPPAFSDKIKNSVFVNPFLEAEIAQYAVLEKHVKMVPQNNCKATKKICWMFKKGNCRFGKKCKFAHNVENGLTTGVNNEAIKDGTNINVLQNQRGTEDEQEIGGLQLTEDDDEPLKKKKRPGLTKGLIPSKKVLNMYKQQKDKCGK